MRKFYIATLLGGVAIAAAGYAWAQGIPLLPSPTGSELITVLPIQPNGQPSATEAIVTLNQVRNTLDYTFTAATTGTVTGMTQVNGALIFTATSVSTTVNLPPNPPDGQVFTIVNGSGGTFTQATVAATDGSTIVPVAGQTGAIISGNSAAWIYTSASRIWYKMR